jgi:Flp pilus assembly protein TadD
MASMPFLHGSISRLALIAALAAVLGGCNATTRTGDITGSIPPVQTEEGWRERANSLAEQYRAQPDNAELAIAYARALRATGQTAQAAAVLQQTSIKNPRDQAVLGAWGRALADSGQYQQALNVLSRAHSPEQPDWRILNAQGAVLDQMGNQAEARRYYETALKIAPDEPAILSNLGLSYALSKDLARAETTLKRAVASKRAEPRVRQNLALVLGLRGKFEESEKMAAGDLKPEEARANVAYLRRLVRQPNPWKELAAEPAARS